MDSESEVDDDLISRILGMSVRKNYQERVSDPEQDRAERWEVRCVASDYTMYLFTSIIIRRPRVLPCSLYLILSSNESSFVLTHRGVAGPGSVTGRYCWSSEKSVFKVKDKFELLDASPLAGVIGKVEYIVLSKAAGWNIKLFKLGLPRSIRTTPYTN